MLKDKDWSLLLSICGCFVAVTGFLQGNSPVVWIGVTITIISYMVPSKDTTI